MKKQILAFLSHKNFHYLLIFLVSCIVALPLIPLQLTNTHDGILHILRLIGTDLSLHYTDFPHLVIPHFSAIILDIALMSSIHRLQLICHIYLQVYRFCTQKH